MTLLYLRALLNYLLLWTLHLLVQTEAQNLTGDAAALGFDNARGIFEWSETGETLTIDHLSFGVADKTASSNDGTFASKGMGVVHFKLPAVDGSSVFMSQVNLDSSENINSEEVLKAHLKDIEDLS